MPAASRLFATLVPRETHFEFSPALAIEVVSSESASTLENKTRLYLKHGSKAVLVLYPEQREAHVRTADGRSRFYGQHETIDLSESFPDLKLQVAGLFPPGY